MIGAIFPNKDKGDTIAALLRGDPQAFIDVMDEACPLHSQSGWLMLTTTYSPHQALETLELSVQARRKYLKILYRTCGFHACLPTTMRISVRYDRTADALYRGGCGDVWKGLYHDQEVAVKVIRTYSDSDLQKVVGVG